MTIFLDQWVPEISGIQVIPHINNMFSFPVLRKPLYFDFEFSKKSPKDQDAKRFKRFCVWGVYKSILDNHSDMIIAWGPVEDIRFWAYVHVNSADP
jgi:hypothetical protein